MSIGICGRIKVVSDNINEMIELAYSIQKCAVNNRIGCKLGGNVLRSIFDMYLKNASKSTILFEVMDSPLDNLFFPMIDGNPNNYEQEFDIKISSSLKIMSNFLKQS